MVIVAQNSYIRKPGPVLEWHLFLYNYYLVKSISEVLDGNSAHRWFPLLQNNFMESSHFFYLWSIINNTMEFRWKYSPIAETLTIMVGVNPKPQPSYNLCHGK